MSFWILLLALIGLVDAAYLLKKKVKKEHLVCFLGDDCERVTKSKYGYIAGVPNEVFGIGYYVLLGFGFLGFLPLFVIQIATVPAVLASLYLLGVQAFILKEWCEYCLLSGAVNIFIALILFL